MMVIMTLVNWKSLIGNFLRANFFLIGYLPLLKPRRIQFSRLAYRYMPLMINTMSRQ